MKFVTLSIAIETVRIVKELMEIWLNEICDIYALQKKVEWPYF